MIRHLLEKWVDKRLIYKVVFIVEDTDKAVELRALSSNKDIHNLFLEKVKGKIYFRTENTASIKEDCVYTTQVRVDILPLLWLKAKLHKWN